MRRFTIALSLAALSGCSFVDDFDKFKAAQGEPQAGEDAATSEAGEPPAGDAAGGPKNDAAAERDAAMIDASASLIDASFADAGSDAYVPPPTCGSDVCDDGDPCTRDTCAGMKCIYIKIDADGDGYAPGTCRAGSSVEGGDCADTNKDVHPGAKEVCDGLDNDCNGKIDEGFNATLCYPDSDGDGYANLDGTVTTTCTGSCSKGTIAVADATDRTRQDCLDDGEDADLVNPGQKEFFERGYRLPNQSGGERSFDYDCSGVEEGQQPLLDPDCGGLGLLGLTCNGSVRGFVGELPKCGESGTFRICGMNDLLTCGINSTEKQLCH